MNAAMALLRRPRALVAGAVVLVLAAGLGLAIARRWYPALIVNGEPVSARRVDLNLRSALFSYDRLRALQAAGRATTTVLAAGEDIEFQVLDRLVDAVLVGQGVRREAGGDLSLLVAEKVGRYENDQGLAEAVRGLYDLSAGDFAREVLVPQAQRDILSGRLFLKGEKFDAWLTNARREARVIIFSDRFRWENGRLVAL